MERGRDGEEKGGERREERKVGKRKGDRVYANVKMDLSSKYIPDHIQSILLCRLARWLSK